MATSDRDNLQRALRTEAASWEARSLWSVRVVAVMGLTALLSFVVSPVYILSFGAARLILYVALYMAAARAPAPAVAQQARIRARITWIRLAMGAHLCWIGLDLALVRGFEYLGTLVLTGFIVATAHQTQPSRRAYGLFLAPPLLSLAALPLLDRTITASETAGTAVLLVTLLLIALRRSLANDRLVEARAEAIHAKAALTESVSQARVAEEVAQMGSWRIRLPDFEHTWSEGVFRIFGLPLAAAPPSIEEVISFYQPGERERVAEMVEAGIRERRGFEFEYAITRRDGERRTLRLRAHFAEEDLGHGSLHGVVQDVTSERNVLDALSTSEARYRLVTNHATDMIATMGPDSRVQFVSPACTQILGYAPEELVGRKTLSFTHPDDVASVVAHFDGLVAAGPQAQTGPAYEFRGRHRDGRYVWLEGRPRIEFGAEGEPQRYQDVVRDVTARKAAEEAVAASRARASENEGRYRLLAENATDMICRYGLDGRILYVSPACATVLGYAPEEMLGRVTLTLIHPDDLEQVRARFAAYLVAPPETLPIHTEHRAIRKDGRAIWLEGRPRLVRDEQGRPIEYHDVMRDVTDRKALEFELERARVAAEEAAHAKSDFLANMSHELRTPLTSIIGYAALVESQDELAANTRGYMRRVQDASRALLNTVNDILDFSKIEAGQVVLRHVPTDATEVCRNMLELLAPQAALKGLDLELEVGAALPPSILVDPDRLSQILLNLIGNAVKFTEHGAVRVRVEYDGQRLAVLVHDTGPGIPPDAIGGLFQRFSQVDASPTRTHGGTGLGLAICRGLAEHMGGSVSVASTFGRGSCFTVRLPAPPVAAQSQAADVVSISRLDGVRVLVVDDTAVTRELARIILSSAGAKVFEARDGAVALEIAGAQPLDCILLDVRMPDIDGWEVLRRLRSMRGLNKTVPVVAYTADAFPPTSHVTQAFDAEVTKPVQPAQLVAVVKRVVDGDVQKLGIAHTAPDIRLASTGG